MTERWIIWYSDHWNHYSICNMMHLLGIHLNSNNRCSIGTFQRLTKLFILMIRMTVKTYDSFKWRALTKTVHENSVGWRWLGRWGRNAHSSGVWIAAVMMRGPASKSQRTEWWWFRLWCRYRQQQHRAVVQLIFFMTENFFMTMRYDHDCIGLMPDIVIVEICWRFTVHSAGPYFRPNHFFDELHKKWKKKLFPFVSICGSVRPRVDMTHMHQPVSNCLFACDPFTESSKILQRRQQTDSLACHLGMQNSESSWLGSQ